MPKQERGSKESSEDAPFLEDREATMDMMRGDEEFMKDLKERHDIEEIFTTNYDEAQKLYERYQKRMAKEGRMTKERAEFLIRGDSEHAGAAQELKSFYAAEKSRLGIEVSPKDAEGIEEYMEMLANKNPRELEKIANKVQIYQKHSEALEGLRQKFREAGESANILDMARKLEEEHEIAQQTVRRPRWMAESGLRPDAFTPQAIVARRRVMKTYNYKVDRLPDVVKSLRALDGVRRDLILEGIFVNTLVERSNQKAKDELTKVFQPESIETETEEQVLGEKVVPTKETGSTADEKIYTADKLETVEIPNEVPKEEEQRVFGTKNLGVSGSARKVFGTSNLGVSEAAEGKDEEVSEKPPAETQKESYLEDSSMYDQITDRESKNPTPVAEIEVKPMQEKLKQESEPIMAAEKKMGKDKEIEKFKKEMERMAIESTFGSENAVDTMVSSVNDADSVHRLILFFNEQEEGYMKEEEDLHGKAGEMYVSLQKSLIRTSFHIVRDRLTAKLWQIEDEQALQKTKKKNFKKPKGRARKAA